jgi:hypothetical protein
MSNSIIALLLGRLNCYDMATHTDLLRLTGEI